MLAHLTAWELLNLVLFVGFISALAGWVGGAGARLGFSNRLRNVESVVMQVLNRMKGAAGGIRAAETRARKSNVELEAEQLAAQLAQRGGWLQRSVPGTRIGRPVRTMADAQEEASLEELEREKEKRRKAGES